MNGEDKRMMNMLIEDKNRKHRKYKVIVDNDSISIEDIVQEETIHNFNNYGAELIVELFKYFGIDAEMC